MCYFELIVNSLNIAKIHMVAKHTPLIPLFRICYLLAKNHMVAKRSQVYKPL